MDAYEEEKLTIGQANIESDEKGYFIEERTSVRVHGVPSIADVNDIDCIDISPKQIISVTTSLIPFLEHDDANRALMGSNMQRQAVSCIVPRAPIVGTGMEAKAARDSGQVVTADEDGEVISVLGDKIIVQKQRRQEKRISFIEIYPHQQRHLHEPDCPRDQRGQKVRAGDVLADGTSTEGGELALGQNVLVAFMSWEGGNYEDAILISSRVVQEDRYSFDSH